MASKEQINILTRMFEERYGLVVGIARRYVFMEDMVDDVIQETYLKFIAKAEEKTWDLSRDIGPLLCQIAKREALLLRRKQQRQRQANERLAERLQALVEDGNGDDEYERLKIETQAMRFCLDKLSLRSRELIERHYFQHRSMADIAVEQQANPATVRHLFHRIRLRLRECIRRTIGSNEPE